MYWLRSYALLLRWSAVRSRATLILNILIQVCLAVGVVVGFSYLVPRVDERTALFFATGAPVLGLITVGMVIGPQEMSASKLEGIFEFNRSLPVPRSAMLAADAAIALVTALPGVLAALLVARVHLDVNFDISPWVVPAILLTGLTAVGLGYGIGYGLSPEASRLISQLVVFFALMFSPVTFPADRLPSWLQSVHGVLPFEHMARAVRETLHQPPEGVSMTPFFWLLGWAVLGFFAAYRAISHRS